MYDIGNMPSTIDIGFTGEKNFRRIEINMAKWMQDMPNGVPSIVHIRPGETQDDAYIAATTFEDNILTWTVTDGDLGSEEGIGIGQVWLEETENLTVNKRGKSTQFATQIHGSINDASETVPAAQAAWLEQMTVLKTQTVSAAEDAEDAQEAAEAAQAAAEAAAASINNVIDDSAGDGDMDVTWSADKLVDEFADKADLSDIPDVSGFYTKPSGGIPSTDLSSDVNTSLGKADSAYQKPSGGIPSTDMASAVQTSLGKANSAYQKPSGGIPGTDMASAVQTSLGKADSAYQKPSGGIPSTDIASGVIPDVSGKLDAPSTAGTIGQVLTSDGNGGQSWQDPTGGDPTEIIDDTAGAGDTDKVWSASKSAGEVSTLLSALSARPEIKDSTETGIDLDVSDPNGNVIVRLKDGHIQTKNFNSEDSAEMKNSTQSGIDLDFSDPNGNVLMRLQNGHIMTKHFDSSNAGNMTCYVSPNGLDTNSGDSTHPFQTIQHAIDSGYNRIMLAPGEYKNQKVNISGKHGISIVCNSNSLETNLFESHKRQARAKLDNSIDVTGLEPYNSIFRTALSVDSDSSYYKVFVSQTVDPVYGGSDYYGRVTTYNAILWEITENILDCTRLVPKLTLADCESTAGTFYYDGTYLYVHPTNGTLTGVSYKRLNDDTFTSITEGFTVYNSTDIYIEGVDVQFFPYYGFHANRVCGLLMRDCGFYFTCYGSAAEFHWCNGDLYECNAAKAGADGYGIATGGNTSFYNCNAVYCYDDGISHHDGSTGIIDGGIWTYCKKGGVTPSYGSHVTVKNVIATHNVYGIYFTQSGERVTDGVQYMQNCLAVDNSTKDVKITGYDVVAHGCSYGTKEVDTGASLAEYNCTVIS